MKIMTVVLKKTRQEQQKAMITVIDLNRQYTRNKGITFYRKMKDVC